jgi:ribonuclease HII
MDNPTLEKELALSQQGFSFIAGLDEAGRGAWAGPVVAAAVILQGNRPQLAQELAGVRDSKLMSPTRRVQLFDTIQATALAVGVGISSHRCIDRRRIIFATRRAMALAIARLAIQPDYLLIDALPLPALAIPQDAYPKADARSLSVAAASIIAKVTRDRLMTQLDAAYQGYGFARHKGYGTQSHQAALDALGPCPIHRFSFAPIQIYRS